MTLYLFTLSFILSAVMLSSHALKHAESYIGGPESTSPIVFLGSISMICYAILFIAGFFIFPLWVPLVMGVSSIILSLVFTMVLTVITPIPSVVLKGMALSVFSLIVGVVLSLFLFTSS